MDKWRRNLAVKGSNRTSRAFTFGNKPSGEKENTMILKSRKPTYVNPARKASMWIPNKVPSARKSIPRRLSFPKHDDSISLMNIEDVENTINTIPGKQEEVHSSLDKNQKMNRNYVMEENIGVKKETMDYLKSIGVLPPSSSNKEKLVKFESPVSQVTVSDPAKGNVVSFTVQSPKLEKKTVGLRTDVANLKSIVSRQFKEKEDLREKYKKEAEDLEKQHQEELMSMLHSLVEEEVPKFSPCVPFNRTPLQDINALQDSFLRTPSAGTWLVSQEKDDLSFNNTPTLGLNSMIEDVTLCGQQQYLETPAARREVTKRILQGIESLFLEK